MTVVECVMTAQGKADTQSEFIVNVNEDRSVTLESAKFANQFVTILQSGDPGHCSRQLDSVTQHLYIYCKVRPSQLVSSDAIGLLY